MFHVLIWGNLRALFRGLGPPKPPVATGLASRPHAARKSLYHGPREPSQLQKMLQKFDFA